MERIIETLNPIYSTVSKAKKDAEREVNAINRKEPDANAKFAGIYLTSTVLLKHGFADREAYDANDWHYEAADTPHYKAVISYNDVW